jgi:hypothetical protein
MVASSPWVAIAQITKMSRARTISPQIGATLSSGEAAGVTRHG